ncbi:putative amino-acid metabolite efflux pump [Tritonibacter multivorans]|uniref:Putative amino-acid metabolite efflux pump n=1 Tax=Tritonibacter multivorans TaxID=928856 RepID=A0A0P1GM78_9RHOB|nr:EamA family transporter [Tritonibacter multivorans]MDA7422595.1 EamA family transporter [Tritonibacter multivorans]CUH76440.1 putative amino-acid metabolite efflux pump [Tritonibacter multivorans]SFD37907.1 probable blue pigment (indigoidine) exporter [Tritonibacter multivorans]
MSAPRPQMSDLALTALAPMIWGSSYIVTTTFLPGQDPLLVALLRALPAGLLLLVLVRRLPPVAMLWKITLLGALNFAIFWACLFLAAYRLPGGVAATLGAAQPLFVIALSALWLQIPPRMQAIGAALVGAAGVALLVLSPEAQLDMIGVLAGLGGAASMAAGIVLSRKWQGDIPPLTLTAWQMTAGGLLLLPVVAWRLESWPVLDAGNLFGLAYMSLIGGALTYVLWFRGLGRIAPAQVSLLGVLSPLTAVVLGAALAGEVLTVWQAIGAALAMGSLWLGQAKLSPRRRRAPSRA